jgi:acyl dehydratase
MTTHYWEDLTVGAKFESPSYAVEAEEIIEFARRYDPQPFHTDPEAAKGTIFGGLVASGWLTTAVTMRLLVGAGIDVAGGLIGLGVDELRWPKAVRPGDELRIACEVIEATASRSRTDRGTVRIRTTTRNQAGETVQSMVATLLVPRRVG